MNRLKSISVFACIFILVFGAFLYPELNWYAKYTSFYCEKASSLFSSWGEKGQVVFMEETNGSFDAKGIIGNKEVFLPNGEQRGGLFWYSIRDRAYLPCALLCALLLASPFPVLKRFLFTLIGIIALHLLLFFNLYIIIWNKFSQTPALLLNQYGSTASKLLDTVDDLMNNGFGFTFFEVAVIWMSLYYFGKRKA